MTKHNVHIVHSGTGWWCVTRTGRISSRHRTRRRATVVGISQPRRRSVEMVTHARNGRIRSKDS